VHSCDQDDFRFGHYQLKQTTIEVDKLSSIPEIVVWLQKTIGDHDTPDEIVISSPCFGSHDRVRISSGVAWYLNILTSFGPVCHEIYLQWQYAAGPKISSLYREYLNLG